MPISVMQRCAAVLAGGATCDTLIDGTMQKMYLHMIMYFLAVGGEHLQSSQFLSRVRGKNCTWSLHNAFYVATSSAHPSVTAPLRPLQMV